MFEIGRLCVKIAGRDARKKAIIIDVIDNNYVLIDGETRRRKCNINHIEPLNKVLKLKKNLSHKDVVELFKKELDIEIPDKKSRPKSDRPRKIRKTKLKKEEPQPEKPEEKPELKQPELKKELKKEKKETKKPAKANQKTIKEKKIKKAKKKN
ncbi:hypothetical protein JXB41_04660 [Candidatus Woesearchaeota archaeon]|nr:hypothetical protein [Candidatus Woesearchaeota archaeon]